MQLMGHRSVDHVIFSGGNPYLLLSFFDGLQEWEDRFFPMGVARLSSYLQSRLQKVLLEHPEVIGYPLEYKELLSPLLPKATTWKESGFYQGQNRLHGCPLPSLI